MKLVVGIKALNEERHIAAAIESAQAGLAALGGGTVVLADSGSTDRTVEIATAYPGVHIVQLTDPAMRSCGTGAQLAFQASGPVDFFYLLDGDMVLDPDFLRTAVVFLTDHPDYAAVGGRVVEANTDSIEFAMRARNDLTSGSAVAGDVDRLDCGGLYRGDAIRTVGHFADSNLHAFEGFELGARLRARGWKLSRIDAPAVRHHGHAMGGYRLMLRRLRTGYAGGPGEVVRAAWGQPHWKTVRRGFAQLRFSTLIFGWWFALIVALGTGQWFVLAGLLLLPVVFFAVRRRSLNLGFYTLAAWNMIAIGMVQGLARPRRAPGLTIPAADLSDRAG